MSRKYTIVHVSEWQTKGQWGYKVGEEVVVESRNSSDNIWAGSIGKLPCYWSSEQLVESEIYRSPLYQALS